MRIAVLGVGIMGNGMARSLLGAGHEVRVWNRSADKAAALEQHGAVVAATPGEAVRGAELVATMLFDADSVLEVVSRSVGDFAPDSVWLQTSTIGPDGVRRVADFAGEHGLRLLDAPVLGTKGPAEQGRLTCLVSGEQDLLEQARPFLDSVGVKTVYAGREPGQASALKLICNAWVATLTTALGQSVAMAERLDLDPNLFLEAITGGATDMPYAHLKGAAMLAGEYPTAFAVDGAVKDLGLMVDAAREADVRHDLLAAVSALFGHTSAHGYGEQDMAAVRTAFALPDEPL